MRKESQFPAQLTRFLYYALLVAIWGYMRKGEAIADFIVGVALVLPLLRYKGKRLDAKWLLVLLVTGSALWLIGRTIRCHGKWKTFVDTTAGYQISYPACWFNITYQDYRLPTGHYLLFSVEAPSFRDPLELRVYRSPRGDSTTQSPQGLIDEIFDIYNYAYGKVEIISGPSYLPQVSPSLDLPGVEVTYRIKNDYYYYRIIAFQYKDSVYAIETVLPAQHKEEGERVLDRIIKSFKFLP